MRTVFTIYPGIGFKGAVQAEEAKQLTKFLANLPPANPSGQDYVIITGDFNSDPTSEAIGTPSFSNAAARAATYRTPHR